MSSVASDVYARRLLPKGHGYPLWIPEPNDFLPEEYLELGTRIGDVGLVTSDGAFDYLFNVRRPANHPINLGRTPDDFDFVNVQEARDMCRTRGLHPPKAHVSSATMKRKMIDTGLPTLDGGTTPAGAVVSLQYTSSNLKGAMVGLPNGADRLDIRNRDKLRDLALRHGLSWYRHANVSEGRMAPNGSLYLVTGCDKADAWGIATWRSEADHGEISLTFTASQLANGGASYSYSYETYSPATVRVGPETEPLKKNQCIFLRGFKISVRESALAKVVGPITVMSIVGTRPSKILKGGGVPFGHSRQRSSGSDSSGGGSNGSSATSPSASGSVVDCLREETDVDDVNVEMIPSPSEPYHPSKAMNEWLLDSIPGAQVAVTHDDDWINVLDGDSELPSDEEFLRRVCKSYSPTLQSGGAILISSNAEQMRAQSPAMSGEHSFYVETQTNLQQHSMLTNEPASDIPLDSPAKLMKDKSTFPHSRGTAVLPAPSKPGSLFRASSLSSNLSFTPEDVLSPGDIVGEGYLLRNEPIHLASLELPPVHEEELAQKFEVIKQLDTGCYAVVYEVRAVLSCLSPSEEKRVSLVSSAGLEYLRSCSEYGRHYALKCVSKASLDEDALAAQKSEVTIHQSLRWHPNIVTLHRTFETPSFLLLLLEFVPGEDLFYLLEETGHPEPESSTDSLSLSLSRPDLSLLSTRLPSQLLSRSRLELIASLFSQMCSAVAACHDQQVFHRDLKPENFIVTNGWTTLSDGKQECRVVVKLTDFGLSTQDIKSSDMDCGSAPYMSYECRNNLSPTYHPRGADIWTLGVVLVNMLYHCNLWADTAHQACPSFDLFCQQPVNFFMERFSGMTPPVADMLASRVFCLLDDPSDDSTRIDASEFGSWAKALPLLLSDHALEPVVFMGPSQGHLIPSAAPILSQSPALPPDLTVVTTASGNSVVPSPDSTTPLLPTAPVLPAVLRKWKSIWGMNGKMDDARQFLIRETPTATNITDIIMNLASPPTQPQFDVDSLARGRRPRALQTHKASHFGTQQVSSSLVSNGTLAHSSPHAESRDIPTTPPSTASSHNTHSSCSTSPSSVFSTYSKSSNRSVSTATTSLSSSSWRRQDKLTPSPPDGSLQKSIAQNFDVMNGIPWEPDELPHQLYPSTVDRNSRPPRTRQRGTRRPEDTKLDTINERPPGIQSHQSSRNTDFDDTVIGEHRGKTTLLEKMFSGLRR